MKHLTQSSLLARGWSKSLIAALLKDPDKEAVNPNHRRGPPMKLWCEERVTAMEQHCDFVAYQDKRKKRSAAALNAADRKRQELLRAVRDWDARIEVRPMEEVRKAAVSHYDALHARRGHRKKHVTSDAPQHFLDRITCNFIRHELTDYEPLLAALKRKIGRPEAIELVRQKVLTEIAALYPEIREQALTRLTRKQHRRKRPRKAARNWSAASAPV